MNAIIGLLIVMFGSFGQSSSYIPIKKVHQWSWENFWLSQGVFAWIVFPIIGLLICLRQGFMWNDLLSLEVALPPFVYGVLWGIGSLTFGLSMRYLGVALGQSISLGTCAALGTLFPALLKGQDLWHGDGLILIGGVLVTLIGIAVIGYAGHLRSRQMSKLSSDKTPQEFALGKGLIVAFVAGIMSACFALGLDAGQPIKEMAVQSGVDNLYAGLPVILLVTLGGFMSNAVYCFYQNYVNHSFVEYVKVKKGILINNILFSALAGLLWYTQFFCLEIGKTFLIDYPTLLAFSWCILMSLNVIFSNIWGLVLKEWRNCKGTTLGVLLIGIIILIMAIMLMAVSQH